MGYSFLSLLLVVFCNLGASFSGSQSSLSGQSDELEAKRLSAWHGLRLIGRSGHNLKLPILNNSPHSVKILTEFMAPSATYDTKESLTEWAASHAFVRYHEFEIKVSSGASICPRQEVASLTGKGICVLRRLQIEVCPRPKIVACDGDGIGIQKESDPVWKQVYTADDLYANKAAFFGAQRDAFSLFPTHALMIEAERDGKYAVTHKQLAFVPSKSCYKELPIVELPKK